MHDTIGDDLSAVVMPADLPRTSVGHSNELAWRVHDLRQLYNLVYSHAPRLGGSDSLLLVFWRAFLGRSSTVNGRKEGHRYLILSTSTPGKGLPSSHSR